jgi:hypothetical protein
MFPGWGGGQGAEFDVNDEKEETERKNAMKWKLKNAEDKKKQKMIKNDKIWREVESGWKEEGEKDR